MTTPAATGTHAVAIVIPMLNEADNAAALLDDCLHQEPAAAEVIVVDAGSTDGTHEILSEYACALPQLTVLRSEGAPPGRARNDAIRQAHSPLIVTLDAGSRIEPTWLQSMTSAWHAGRVCVGVTRADARSSFERAAGWFTLRAFKPPDRAGPVSGNFLPAGRNGYCFAKADWTTVGCYPDDLPWGEDKRFLIAMREAGFEIVAVPDAEVRWRPRTSLIEVYRQYERYGRGDAMARVDRRNELIPLCFYVGGMLLAVNGIRGSRASRWAAAAAVLTYLGAFTAAARPELGRGDALKWIPLIRLTVDVAKIRGFLAASLAGARAQR